METSLSFYCLCLDEILFPMYLYGDRGGPLKPGHSKLWPSQAASSISVENFWRACGGTLGGTFGRTCGGTFGGICGGTFGGTCVPVESYSHLVLCTTTTLTCQIHVYVYYFQCKCTRYSLLALIIGPLAPLLVFVEYITRSCNLRRMFVFILFDIFITLDFPKFCNLYLWQNTCWWSSV